jgi:hypothetical protein
MTKARDLANLIAAGNPLADGAISVAEISDLTASAADLNATNVTTLGTVEASKVVTADANGDVRFSNSDKIYFGASDNLFIHSDGTNSYIKETGSGDLLIGATNFQLKSGDFSETLLRAVDDGGVFLYYNDAAKLETVNSGINVTGELIADSYNETYAAVTSTSNATTVNCEAGNSFSHTLTENTTFTFSNPPASGTAYTFSVEIIQDSGGSGHTVTWPGSVDWPAATAPTLTATASAKDIFVFTTRDGGTNWYGFTAGQALG